MRQPGGASSAAARSNAALYDALLKLPAMPIIVLIHVHVIGVHTILSMIRLTIFKGPVGQGLCGDGAHFHRQWNWRIMRPDRVGWPRVGPSVTPWKGEHMAPLTPSRAALACVVVLASLTACESGKTGEQAAQSDRPPTYAAPITESPALPATPPPAPPDSSDQEATTHPNKATEPA